MKDIYERAEEVLAWLGPELYAGKLALSNMEKIFNHYNGLFGQLGSHEAAFQHMLEHKSWASEIWEDDPLVPQERSSSHTLSKSAWRGIETLLKGRPWFRRVWIVQEVSRALCA